MRIRSAIEKMLNLQAPGLLLSMLLLPLWLCSLVFRLVAVTRVRLYGIGVFKSFQLPCRVVTVGNITVGGTNKTPTVCSLARSLADTGLRTAVLSRGYGGSSKGPLIVSDGSRLLAAADEAGDEPCMLAGELEGIPVVTSRDRYRGGLVACERFGTEVLVLDDGFQHLRLRRDLDIVLINSRNPFGCGALIPRGILREPLGALARARIIVLTKVESGRDIEELEHQVRRINPDALIFHARLKPTALLRPATGETLPLDTVRGHTAAGLCSIGDPGYFFSMLADLGISYNRPLIFPDHHRYTAEDCRLISGCATGAQHLITTQKDIAKLKPDMLQVPDLLALHVRQCIDDKDGFTRAVRSRLGLE